MRYTFSDKDGVVQPDGFRVPPNEPSFTLGSWVYVARASSGHLEIQVVENAFLHAMKLVLNPNEPYQLSAQIKGPSFHLLCCLHGLITVGIGEDKTLILAAGMQCLFQNATDSLLLKVEGDETVEIYDLIITPALFWEMAEKMVKDASQDWQQEDGDSNIINAGSYMTGESVGNVRSIFAHDCREEKILEAKLKISLELLLVYALYDGTHKPAAANKQTRLQKTWQVIERIRKQPGIFHEPEKIAKELGIDLPILEAEFEAIALAPLQVFILACTMHEAKRELMRGDTPMETIARELGYTSIKVFRIDFKAFFGQTWEEMNTPSLNEN